MSQPQPGDVWYHRHLRCRFKVHLVDRQRNLVHGWINGRYTTRYLSHFDNPKEGWTCIVDSKSESR